MRWSGCYIGQRFDTVGAVDLLGNLVGGIQFADAELLNHPVAFGLLFRFGLRQRQVQARRHRAERPFHAAREDHAFAELSRLVVRGR